MAARAGGDETVLSPPQPAVRVVKLDTVDLAWPRKTPGATCRHDKVPSKVVVRVAQEDRQNRGRKQHF